MKRRFLLFFVLLPLLAAAPAAYAQRVLRGKVADEQGRALAGATVEIKAAGHTVAFASSEKDGSYCCHLPADCPKALVATFRKLNYSALTERLSTEAKRLDVTLRRGSHLLGEAVVKAPPVKTSGDTVRYQLKAFMHSGDHSLEDALKRLPGLKVDGAGAISYMGRNISHFYIEDLDLLGGHYNLATRNIPAENVAGVEVLRHHSANKVDRNKLSDDVALNIKLSARAKLKPFGSYEARLGARSDCLLYGASGAGMLFRKDFQLLSTLKAANDGRMGANELRNHSSGSSRQTDAERALPLLSGSRPSVAAHRFMDSRDGLFSFNAIRKFAADRQMKVNTDYSYGRQRHGDHVLTRYPEADGLCLTSDERSDYGRREHRAGLGVNFRSDREHCLVENHFSFQGRFARAESATLSDGLRHSARQATNSLGLSNEFSMVRRVGKWRLDFDSRLFYKETPDNALDVSRAAEASIRQTAESRAFRGEAGFHTSYDVLPELSLSLPLNFSADVSRLHTLWAGDTSAVNALQGGEVDVSLSPRLEYQGRRRRFRAVAACPLSLLSIDYRNAARGAAIRFTRLHAHPALELYYVPSGRMEWKASASFNHRYGDMTDLLVAPIQTDHRTLRIRSGVFGRSKVLRADCSFAWQEPLSFFHFTARAGYSRRFNNLISGQQVDADGQELLQAVRDNVGDNVSFALSASKYVLPWKTGISADASCSWTQQESLSGGRLLTTVGRGYQLGCDLTSSPVRMLEAAYRFSFQKNFLHNAGARSSADNWRQHFRLSLLPSQSLSLSAALEWQRNSLLQGGYKSFSFLDAGAEYRFKKPKLRLRLELNNLLNARSYRYTVYVGPNAVDYNYRLNGRELLLSLVLH